MSDQPQSQSQAAATPAINVKASQENLVNLETWSQNNGVPFRNLLNLARKKGSNVNVARFGSFYYLKESAIADLLNQEIARQKILTDKQRQKAQARAKQRKIERDFYVKQQALGQTGGNP